MIYEETGLREKVIRIAEQAGFRAEVGGKCPCGEVYAVSITELALAHSMPPCKEFVDKEMDEYLHFINQGLLN